MSEKKIKYPCPGCKDMFDSITALTAHTESQSIRCQFRHSKNYGHFLSQALAGIVDVVGEDVAHGTVEYAISKDAKKTFGVSTPAKDDARRSRSDEFKAATAALEERALDEDEQNRKMWEEHEREVEVRLAQEREEQRMMQAKKEQEMKLKEQQAREAEQNRVRKVQQERTRQAKLEQEMKLKVHGALLGEQERIRQEIERDRKANEDAREAEHEHVRKTEEQRARRADEERIQKVWEAQQERAQQARLAQGPKSQQQSAQPSKNPQKRAIKQEFDERKTIGEDWVRIKQESSEVSADEDLLKLEEEECRLLEKLKKIKEQRWKLQQEKEKRAVDAARNEMEKEKGKKAVEQAQEVMQTQHAGLPFNPNW